MTVLCSVGGLDGNLDMDRSSLLEDQRHRNDLPLGKTLIQVMKRKGQPAWVKGEFTRGHIDCFDFLNAGTVTLEHQPHDMSIAGHRGLRPDQAIGAAFIVHFKENQRVLAHRRRAGPWMHDLNALAGKHMMPLILSQDR